MNRIIAAVGVILTLVALHGQYSAQVSRAALKAAQSDLAASRQALARAESEVLALRTQSALDALQATQREALAEPVKQAHRAVKQGAKGEVLPRASEPQLERLRKLAEAANRSIAAARSLP